MTPRLVRLRSHTVPVSAKTAWIVLEAALEDGTVGYGEASLFGEEAAVVAEVAAFDAALGEGLPVVGPVLAVLHQVGTPPARAVLKSGLEGALLDGLARRAGLPLCALLGGPYRPRIPAYANINRGTLDRSPEGFGRRAREIVATEGYREIKIAPFDGVRWREANADALAAGLARIAAVREAVGPEVGIRVDCHGRFNRPMAERVVAAVAALDLVWIEDPLDPDCPAEDRRAVRDAAHRAGMMVAGGEAIATLADARRFVAEGGHDVMLPDLRETGILDGLAILRLAVAAGLHASLHNPAGPVLDALSRQVAAALPSFLVLERQVGESPLYDALRGGTSVPVTDGTVGLDEGPGIGFAPDPATLAEAARTPLALARSFAGIPGAGPNA